MMRPTRQATARPAAALAAAALALALGACGTTEHWSMPQLVTDPPLTLQEAQDRLDRVTGGAVETTSHDHKGADREQGADGEWLVCGQSVAPGATVTEESSVDFAVVHTGERC